MQLPTRVSMVFLLSIIVLATSGCGWIGKEEKRIEDFTFTDQNGNPFGLSDLNGKVWVADFIFTNCTTVCPPMTINMKRLQDELKEEGLEVELVSFSVDPEVDTPEKLKGYMEYFKADPENWHFLTGYSMEVIQRFAKDNFNALVQKPADSDQVVHGTSFYLIDQNGILVEKFSGIDNNLLISDMIKEVKSLLK